MSVQALNITTIEEAASEPNILHSSRTPQIDIIASGVPVVTFWEYENLSAPYWRFYYNFSGKAEMVLSGRRYELIPDHGYLIAPETPYSSHLTATMEHLNILFYVNLPFDHITRQIFELGPLPDYLVDMCLELRNKQHTSYELPRWIGLAIVANVMYWMRNQIRFDLEIDPRVLPALNKIAELPCRNYRIEQLAAICKLGVDNFIRIWRGCMNTPPHTYMMKVRMRYACRYLIEPNMSIDDVAHLCDFSDRFQFSKMFKKYWQQTPGAFRKRNIQRYHASASSSDN